MMLPGQLSVVSFRSTIYMNQKLEINYASDVLCGLFLAILRAVSESIAPLYSSTPNVSAPLQPSSFPVKNRRQSSLWLSPSLYIYRITGFE
jgi:hypothetical protein